MTRTDDRVIDALTALRDAGLVTDRDQLNVAWRALTGRTDPAGSNIRRPSKVGRCDACGRPGAIPWREPAGSWHPGCLPQLWRPADGNRWATPRCSVCGRPGGYPANRWRTREPRCRTHAPEPMRAYLTTNTEENPA